MLEGNRVNVETFRLTTQRLILRPWCSEDLKPFIEMNRHPEVMRFFPTTISEEASAKAVDRFGEQFQEQGFCYFAAESRDSGQFLGFIGLMPIHYDMPSCAEVDLGWRLIPSAWGQGLATEGARACIHYAFDKLQIPRLAAVAPQLNKPSIGVMEKLGMRKGGQFEHPAIPADSPLNPCVYYEITSSPTPHDR